MSFKDSRENFNPVFFSPRSEYAAGCGSAFIKFLLYVCVGEFQTRRAAIDYDAYTSTVAFTKAGYNEVFPNGVT
jgi:hypothetical protein